MEYSGRNVINGFLNDFILTSDKRKQTKRVEFAWGKKKFK